MSLVPLPKVPTDNLYKFLALSGVLLIVFGAYWPAHEADQWYARVDAWTERQAIHHVRTDIDRGLVWKAIDSRAKALANPTDTAKANAAEEKLRELAESEMQFEVADRQAWKEEAAKNTVERDVLERMGKQALTRTRICWLLIGVGFLLAMFGFWRWYFKIQVHVDRAYAAGVFGKGESKTEG